MSEQRDAESMPIERPTLRELDRTMLPPALSRTDFDLDRGFEVRLGQSTWTTVPPKDIGSGTEDPIRAIVEEPHSWLVVRKDGLSNLQMLELVVARGAGRGEARVELLRSSGRALASGTLTVAPDGGLRFEVTVHGVARPGRGGEQPIFTGRLTRDGKLQLQSTLV
jgi:hypothetical protein